MGDKSIGKRETKKKKAVKKVVSNTPQPTVKTK